MILVDTSVWIDHLRDSDWLLAELLDHTQVLTHPFVIGELAVGNIQRRSDVLSLIKNLPRAVIAADDEVIEFIDRQLLFGRGIGYGDAHLLASTLLTPGTVLWTRDKRLQATAEHLSVAMRFD